MHALCLKASLRAVVLPFCLTFAASELSVRAAADSASKKMTVEEILQTMNVDFVIKGKVTDQDGKPLSNVKLQITSGKATGPFARSEHTEEKVVNDHFEFTYSGNSSVQMWFRLEGYHPVTQNFTRLGTDPGVRIEGHTHYYDQVTVVLRKMGKITPLNKYSPIVKWNSTSGAVSIWNIAGVREEQAETECVESLAIPGRELPCVYVHAAKSEVPISPLMEGREELSPRDGSIEIVLQDGKQGGFCRFSPKTETIMETGVEMTTAPTDGYTTGLRLTKEDLAGLRHGAKVYFFVRLNGMYGKGYVNGLAYKPTSGIESCCLEICLQPDGSINVETRSW